MIVPSLCGLKKKLISEFVRCYDAAWNSLLKAKQNHIQAIKIGQNFSLRPAFRPLYVIETHQTKVDSLSKELHRIFKLVSYAVISLENHSSVRNFVDIFFSYLALSWPVGYRIIGNPIRQICICNNNMADCQDLLIILENFGLGSFLDLNLLRVKKFIGIIIYPALLSISGVLEKINLINATLITQISLEREL